MNIFNSQVHLVEREYFLFLPFCQLLSCRMGFGIDNDKKKVSVLINVVMMHMKVATMNH